MNSILILTVMKNRYLRDGLFAAVFRGGLSKSFAGRKAACEYASRSYELEE